MFFPKNRTKFSTLTALILSAFLNKITGIFDVKASVKNVKMKLKIPMEHLNITEFNRGQSSKVIKKLVEEDKAAYINKNGKPIAVIMSNERYERLIAKGIDINEY